MGLGDLNGSVRRIAAAAALAGIALYTMLLPGHIVSQAMLAADAGTEPICHEDMAGAGHPGPSPAPEDPKPTKTCPFCKGYATFLTAFAGGAGGAVLDATRETALAANLGCGLAHAIALTPQSRGPPIAL